MRYVFFLEHFEGFIHLDYLGFNIRIRQHPELNCIRIQEIPRNTYNFSGLKQAKQLKQPWNFYPVSKTKVIDSLICNAWCRWVHP